jgi:two-component system, cell cycle sensor histidine kinase and response regulator CckA
MNHNDVARPIPHRMLRVVMGGLAVLLWFEIVADTAASTDAVATSVTGAFTVECPDRCPPLAMIDEDAAAELHRDSIPILATILRSIAWIAFPLLLILLTFLAGSWSLRKLVARRTEELRRSEQRIEHLNRVLRAVRSVNQLIIRERDQDKLIHEGCRLLVEQRSYDTALILLTDEHDHPQSWATAGMEEVCVPLEDMLRHADLPGCCVAARNAKEPHLVAHRMPICEARTTAAESMETHTICVQLRQGDTAYGYLAVTASQDLDLGEEEQRLLAEMAGDLAYALSSIRDRTARAQAEQARNDLQQQLLHAQKMDAVGQLAGGVAHDFNNILQVMMGYIQILIDAASEKGEPCEELREIYRGTERAAALTRQLLSFSRRQVLQQRTLDMNALVENSLPVLRRVIGAGIGLDWLPAHQLRTVHADPAMMEQVLMNLSVNAREAMPRGGVLTIQTRNAQIDAEYCARQAFARPGAFVRINVTDTGCGMDPAILGHIFEPFFTTKEIGAGPGLGLATVHGIVKQHGGWIEVTSQLGRGTDFSIFLPALPSELASVTKPADPGPVRGGTETILLVEDEQSLRALTRRFLENRAYTVIEASSGREALAIWPEHRDEIDLLMTDLVMPEGISGRELAERLRVDKPSLKVILTSGYSPDVAGKDTGLIEHGDI